MNEFFSGMVTTHDGNQTALVFVSRKTLPALSTATEILSDGTFDCVPRLFYQLATINVIAYDYVNTLFLTIGLYDQQYLYCFFF